MYDNDQHMYHAAFLLKTKAQQAPEVSAVVRSWNQEASEKNDHLFKDKQVLWSCWFLEMYLG